MNPHCFFPILDFDSPSYLSPFQGFSWQQPPLSSVEPRYSTPYMSLEETCMENHSNQWQHFTPAGEVFVGSVEMMECGETRSKKRKGKELETHSTCEKKRRGRIAERMKTLQELLPNSSYKLSAASVLDKAIEHIKSLQLQKTVLGYQQMMMDGLLIPTQHFPAGDWDNSSDSTLMVNSGGIVPGINMDSTHDPSSTNPGLSYDNYGLFSSVTGGMPDSEFFPQLLQSTMPIPGPFFYGLGGSDPVSPTTSSPGSLPISLPAGLVSFHLDSLF